MSSCEVGVVTFMGQVQKWIHGSLSHLRKQQCQDLNVEGLAFEPVLLELHNLQSGDWEWLGGR